MSEYPYGMSWRGVKIAAGRLGITSDEYLERMRAGDLWCSNCRGWLPADRFYVNPRRQTGRGNLCREHQAHRMDGYRRGVVTVYGGAR